MFARGAQVHHFADNMQIPNTGTIDVALGWSHWERLPRCNRLRAGNL
jgi:hypothetical protein